MAGPVTTPTHVRGRVTNRGAETIRHLRVQIPQGMQAGLATVLAPGESVDVHARLTWPEARSAPRTADNPRLLFAAADRALAHSGVVALAGELRSAARAGRRAVRLVVQTVEPGPEAAPPAVRQVSALPIGEGTGRRWLDVYDLAVPAGRTVASSLVTTPGDHVDVYDWDTRLWRPLPLVGVEPASLQGSDERPWPLLPGELSGDVVRVRAEEAPGARLAARSRLVTSG